MEATARLMRTLAHEVSNPLSSIALATESIEMEETKENCEPYLGMIRRNTSRIDSIITKVLDSARVQSISLEKGSFTAVLKDAIDAVARHIGRD